MASSRCGCPHPRPETSTRYADTSTRTLNDAWLPGIPLVPAEKAISDWLNGWAGRPSRDGPVLVVTIPEEPGFIGIIGLGDRGDGIIEMVYGIAPRWRGRGLASRATRLAARWALSQPGVTTVELRIDQGHTASQHVAENAGFTRAGTVTQHVPAPGRPSRTCAMSWRGERRPVPVPEPTLAARGALLAYDGSRDSETWR